MELIDNRILKRTKRAIKCLDFNQRFYQDADSFGITAEEVFEMDNKYIVPKYSAWLKNTENVEAKFRWLIIIGVLRREVDGQGLTSKVRLTPLGREILQRHPELQNQKANLYESVSNWFVRKLIFH